MRLALLRSIPMASARRRWSIPGSTPTKTSVPYSNCTIASPASASATMAAQTCWKRRANALGTRARGAPPAEGTIGGKPTGIASVAEGCLGIVKPLTFIYLPFKRLMIKYMIISWMSSRVGAARRVVGQREIQPN